MRRLLLVPLAVVACEAPEPPPAPAITATKPTATLRSGLVQDAVHGRPIAGAVVGVEGTLRKTTTDAEGRYTLEMPAGFGRITVEAPGFLATTSPAESVRLWPERTTDEDAHTVLDARELGRMRRDQDDLADPDLSSAARTLLTARRAHPLLSDAELFPQREVLKGGVEVPATVRVYRRGAENDSCQGRVEVLPLEEYVRGVVPHEWIPSWHIESLKAGAVAARTYAANWVVAGGKYDCADVDDTTRSQVYRDDRNARADDAVRATACEVVVRDGALVNAEYSAENGDPTAFGVRDELCTGRELFGHGRGMCQWGSQRWADQRGQTYRWMVEHYYPGATVGNGCADPVPDVQLRQRLARVDEEPCIDPETSYNCADFVRQGWSVDIFDLFVGRRFELAVEVSNTGAAPGQGVALHVDLPPSLVATAVTVDGGAVNAPLGGAGATVQVPVGAVAAGATKRVALTLRGAGSSLSSNEPAPVRTWVARIDGHYEKPDFNAAPRQNEGQTFNGGDLKVMAEFDVFPSDSWQFDANDAEMAEGFVASDGSAVRTAGGALQVPAQGVVSPFTHIDAERRTEVEARGLAGRLFWRQAGASFDAARSMRVDGTASLAGAAGWQGEIQQVRFEPDRAGALDALIFRASGGAPDPDAAVEPEPQDASVAPDTEPHEPLPDLPDVGGQGGQGGRGGSGGGGQGGQGGQGGGLGDAGNPPPGARGVVGNTSSGCQSTPGAPGGLAWLLLAPVVLLRRSRNTKTP